MHTQLVKFFKYASLLAVIPLVLFGLYIWAALSWVYSSGERAGYVQKLSHKGWICKTHEGELILVSMPGTQAEKFYFTVHDDAVVKKINTSVGSRVRLIYEEHKGLPSTCFGETSYFVTDVKLIDKEE
jgi:hypothetical protein